MAAEALVRVLLLAALPSVVVVHALDNGLGLKPSMGFNTWNHFHCTC